MHKNILNSIRHLKHALREERMGSTEASLKACSLPQVPYTLEQEVQKM